MKEVLIIKYSPKTKNYSIFSKFAKKSKVKKHFSKLETIIHKTLKKWNQKNPKLHFYPLTFLPINLRSF